MSCGFNVVRNGTHQWKSTNTKMIRFVCSRYRKFRGNTRSIDDDQVNFHQHDYHNDQKHSHGRDGIHYQRKTWTKRTIILEHTCSFYFYVAFDSKDFLLFQAMATKIISIIISNVKANVEFFVNQDVKSQKKTKN